MSTENIYEIIKASNQVSNVLEETAEVEEGSNSNTLLWVLGGSLILMLIYKLNTNLSGYVIKYEKL